MSRGERERLSKRRSSYTYSLTFLPTGENPIKMHVSLGYYEDGRLGEVWVEVSKIGSFFKATLSAWAMVVSKALQWGMPVSELVDTHRNVSAVPGIISCEAVEQIHGKQARSPWDAIAQLIEAEASASATP